jgi:hypothetical protein
MSTQTATAPPIPDLYLSSLPDDLRANFQVALHRTSLDSEIALLRVQIEKLMKHDPDNLKLMLRVVHLIERLTKCNLQISKENTPAGKRSRQDSKLDDVFYPPSAFTDRDEAKPASVDRRSPETPPTPAPETISENRAPVPVVASEESTPSSPVAVAAAVSQHRTWSTSSVAKKAPARLPASAQTLFHKKKHKKHWALGDVDFISR